MNDHEILGSIDQMVAEEHRLWDAAEQGPLTDDRTRACASCRSTWTVAGTCCASAAPSANMAEP